jgi:hypothetical protein
MSHNVLARTSRVGEETVVEAITKVQSIDLVADPATTSGLYEHVATGGSPVAVSTSPGEPPGTTLATLTLEQLRQARPDLVCEVERAYESQLARVQQQLDEMIARDAARRRRERVLELLQEHDLPLPTSNGSADSRLVSPQFLETLMHAADEETVRRLIEERAALVRSACEWNRQPRRTTARRPRSRHQLEFPFIEKTGAVHSGQEFAAAIRGN